METIGWRLRQDLEVHSAGSGMWVVKDPLRLAYFRMSDVELNLLQEAGSGMSLEKLSARLAAEYPGYDWSLAELRRILGGAVQAGLMCAAVPGIRPAAAVRLPSSGGLNRLLRGWWSLISFRWRAVDPDPLLRRLQPLADLILQPIALTLAGLLVLSGVVLTVVRGEALIQELPTLARLLTPENLMLMTAAIMLVRGLHELGHALVCRHFGGECRELGLQVTLFVPFPYCDVSDSWLWPDRWKRMAAAGAGMGVEFLLAGVAAMIWSCTFPGLLHSFCLNVMLLCSLNTLLVNGNPLLKYDGYYLLSDLCGVPNLSEAGSEEAGRFLQWLVTGQTGAFASERPLWARIGLALYGTAASVYRVLIAAGLLLLLYRFLEPTGLGFAMILPGIMAYGAAAVSQCRRLLEQMWCGRTHRSLQLRATMIACLILAAFCIPFSLPIRAPFVLTPGNSMRIYAKGTGRLEWQIESGSRVQAGDVLARLWNGDLAIRISEAEGEVARRSAAVEGLRLQQLQSTGAVGSPATAEELLESARNRLQVLRTAEQELTILSPCSGIVFPPGNLRQSSGNDGDGRGVFSSRIWPAPNGRNTWLEPQTELCAVGERTELRAFVCVRQSDAELLQPGGEVQLCFDSRPADPVAGILRSVSGTVLKTVPPELVLTQRISADASGQAVAGEVWYPAEVSLEESAGPQAALYTTGTALLESRPASLWSRMRRLAELTFAWPF
jgi:putative peptide zinc metalloprotease protein